MLLLLQEEAGEVERHQITQGLAIGFLPVFAKAAQTVENLSSIVATRLISLGPVGDLQSADCHQRV